MMEMVMMYGTKLLIVLGAVQAMLLALMPIVAMTASKKDDEAVSFLQKWLGKLVSLLVQVGIPTKAARMAVADVQVAKDAKAAEKAAK
jgi:branched-subunit amino acid transport protein AzlD